MRKKAGYLFLAVFLLAGCLREKPLLIVGSSCMGRAMRILAEGSPWEVEVQLGGTQLGLTALKEGRADLAACSRALGEEDEGIEAFLLASDAIGVAVHPSNSIQKLSHEQLRAVYEGVITDWSELGGDSGPIAAIGRESGSGTRSAFESALSIKTPVYSQELGETGIVRTAVAGCPGAIGYLSAAYADGSVRLLAVDEILPTEEAVRNGSYPLTRPFLLCRRAGDSDEKLCRFLSYAEKDGAALLKSAGFFTE